jgi:hypothetical protein
VPGAYRPLVNTSAPSPAVCQAAILAQQGTGTKAIAQAQGCSEREVRRRLAAARAAGLSTAPAPAQPTAPPARKPGSAKVLSGHTGQQIRSSRSRDRGDLGPYREVGDLDEYGRVLMGHAAGVMAPRRALDAFREGPPPGAAYAVHVDDDGNVIAVEPV